MKIWVIAVRNSTTKVSIQVGIAAFAGHGVRTKQTDSNTQERRPNWIQSIGCFAKSWKWQIKHTRCLLWWMERHPAGLKFVGRSETVRLELLDWLSRHIQRENPVWGHRRQTRYLQVDAERTHFVLSWLDVVRRWASRSWHCHMLR